MLNHSFVAGGVNINNVQDILRLQPFGLDLVSSMETHKRQEGPSKDGVFHENGKEFSTWKRYFGSYGGQFVQGKPWSIEALAVKLEAAYSEFKKDRVYQTELAMLLRDFAGRPTPLYLAPQLEQSPLVQGLFQKGGSPSHGGHKDKQYP